MVLKWFGNDRSLSWEQRSDHLPWEAVVEAVAVLAPWNDETCPLGDGRCGAWLSAGRPSRQPGCAVQNVDNLRLHPFHLNSSDITFRHHTHHIHHIHRIDFQYINGLTRSHLSRPQDVSGLGLVQTRPGRPGRAELVTTAAFRLKDLWAVASRSPR